MMALRRLLALWLALAPLAACQVRGQEEASEAPQEVVSSVPEVLARFPHDPDAFTQGLLYHEGLLYESTGRYGRSSLREVQLETGEVLRSRALERRFFGEGLALVNRWLYQLTWREGVVFVYERESFELVGLLGYEGEGWGLCFDGRWLYMSDGSASLTRRDPRSFAVMERLEVTLRNRPLERLNELACVGHYVYANVFMTDTIVQIDTRSGHVVREIDASGLLTAEERAALGPEAVLNGIAFNPATETFYLTGKLWPRLFEVRFVER